MSSHTAKEMNWHATRKYTEPGKMQHLVDGRAWKNFDTKYSYFAKEPINVRLGLAADGFNSSLDFNGETEDGDPPRKFDQDDIMAQLARLPTRVKGKHPIKKFCHFIKGVKLPDGFGYNFKHKVTDNDTNIMGLKSYDYHIMMQRLLPYGLQQYLPADVAKPIIKLCLFFKKIYTQTLIEDDMLKAQSKVADILRNLELIYPSDFFDIMIYLVIYLPLEALEGEPIRPRHDERRTTQNYDICLPGEDGEMYYDEGVIVVEDDLDIIHVNNSSDLALTTSLNDFKIVALHIDGQSIDVDAPPDIIDVDKDDDIIDDEDVLPYDLADFNDEDLVNMSADVARGHDDDGGDDDRPPSHQLAGGCRGKGTQKPNLGGRKAGRMHTRKETKNLGLRKITDELGLQSIQFEWKDNGMMKGIDQHLGKIYTDNKSSLKRDYWVKNLMTRLTTWKLSVPTSREYLCRRLGCAYLVLGTRSLAALRDKKGLGTYTDDQIMAMVRGGKQREHIPGVGRVLAKRGKDVLDVLVPRCNHTFDVNELKKSNKQKRPCVRKPFPLNSDIIDGFMQHGTINSNRISGDSQLDQPAYIGKCVATELDTSTCNLYDRSARHFRSQVKRSREGGSGASTATKCSLAQKCPCGILTGLPMSGGLEFGKCYNLPALSGPWIDGLGIRDWNVTDCVTGLK
nr:hypothetical protein [Tanacetum cinerariifolium]